MSNQSKMMILIILLLLLMGCSSNPKTVTFDENFSHPELPNPVQPYTFDFNVITNENKDEKINEGEVYLAIDYNDSLVFRQFLEDMKRYMLESNQVICYYRKELEEQFCINQDMYINAEN